MTVPAGIIVGWPASAGSIPAGWNRVAALDGRFPKGIPNASTNPGTDGGSATHSHTTPNHSHSVNHSHTTATNTGAGSGSTVIDSGTSNTGLAPGHTHTRPSTGTASVSSSGTSPGVDTSGHDPSNVEIIWISSDGTPAGVPENAVVLFDSTDLPDNWPLYGNSGNRFLKGAVVAGDGGGTNPGDLSHTHSVPSHTHAGTSHSHTSSSTGASSPASSVTPLLQPDPITVATPNSHNHPVTISSGSSASLSSAAGGASDPTAADEPPFHILGVIQNQVGSPFTPSGMIAIWMGILSQIPEDWVLCDGNNGTPNLLSKYVKGANDTGAIGTTGGSSASHSHSTPTHTHTTSGHSHSSSAGSASSTQTRDSGSGFTASSSGHTHSLSATNSATPTVDGSSSGTTGATAIEPLHTEVAFIQLQIVTPNEPDLVTRTVFNADLDAEFSWVFSHPNVGESQSAFEVQIFHGEDLVLDTGKVVSASSLYVLTGGTLSNDEMYTWRVRVWDTADEVSGWPTADEFTTHDDAIVIVIVHQSLQVVGEGEVLLDAHEIVIEQQPLIVERFIPETPVQPPLYVVPVLTLSRNGDSLRLPFTAEGSTHALGDHGWCLAPGIEGLDQPATSLFQQRAAGQFGSYARGVDVPAREIFLPLLVHANSYPELLHLRDMYNRLTSPYHGRTVRITLQRPGGASRYIDGFRVGEAPSWDRATWVPRVAMQKFGQLFICPDPWWRGDPVSLQWSGSSPTDFFPITPVQLSSDQLLGVPQVIDVPGDVIAYPTFTITGPTTSITATHVESGRSWTFNAVLDAAEVAMIHTDPRFAAEDSPVHGPNEENWFQYLEPPYDLWSLPIGPQTIEIEITGLTSATLINVSVQPLYETA